MQDIEISVVYRGRRYWTDSDICEWFEPCPIVRHTPKTITVRSETYPDSTLYPGGEFTLKRDALLRDGKVYHSRHGEYFWLEKPRLGDLFPSQDVLNMPSATKLEADALGWDMKKLSDRQLMAFLLAQRTHIPLEVAMQETPDL